MNNTKVAVIYSEKKPHTYYINNNLGLMEAMINLPKNYHVEFFLNTPVMGAFEKNGRVMWFKNTTKALSWGVNKYFEPNIVVCVGNPNYAWDKVIPENVFKIFVYDSYEEPKVKHKWDEVIVPIEDDKILFPYANVMTVYNSNLFRPSESQKHFTYFYPQLVSNLDLMQDINFGNNTISFTEEKNLFYLSDFSSKLMCDLLNQSQVACILEPENDIELALSALACKLPVVTVEDLKCSMLPIIVSLATTPDYEVALQQAVDLGTSEIDLSDYTIESFNKKFIGLIK